MNMKNTEASYWEILYNFPEDVAKDLAYIAGDFLDMLDTAVLTTYINENRPPRKATKDMIADDVVNMVVSNVAMVGAIPTNLLELVRITAVRSIEFYRARVEK